MRSVKSNTENEDIGYIRISSFTEQTQEGLEAAIADIKKKTGNKLKGYVIDLRNNPGGLLDQAISVSDTFLDRGEVVSTRGRNADETQRFNAQAGDLADGKPVVVLINGGSASASEIVAGALQDHKRATVIGTRSFGKGSVQTIIPLGSQGALRLTTARYYTPAGRSIQAKGIDADIVIEQELPPELQGKDTSTQGEASLRGHLNNEAGGEEGGGSSAYVPEDKTKDVQLKAALDLLHGVKVVIECEAEGRKAVGRHQFDGLRHQRQLTLHQDFTAHRGAPDEIRRSVLIRMVNKSFTPAVLASGAIANRTKASNLAHAPGRTQRTTAAAQPVGAALGASAIGAGRRRDRTRRLCWSPALWLLTSPNPYGGEPVLVLDLPPAKEMADRLDHPADPSPACAPAQERTPAIPKTSSSTRLRTSTSRARPIRQAIRRSSRTRRRSSSRRGAPCRRRRSPPLPQEGPYGPLPRIGAGGKRPSTVYARTASASIQMSDAPKIAIVLGGMGLNQELTAKAIKALARRCELCLRALWREPAGAGQQGARRGSRDHAAAADGAVRLSGDQSGAEDAAHQRQRREANLDALIWHMSRFAGYIGASAYMGGSFLAEPAACGRCLPN